MIPHDDFTPHGYLDNPYHSWKQRPGGVLRSLPPLGMGWHMPNVGSYVNNQFQYTAHLTLGLKIDDLVLATSEEFQEQPCVFTCPTHTKNRFVYQYFLAPYDLTVTVLYVLIQEHILGCTVTLATKHNAPLDLTCYFIHLHTHNPHTSRLWEHGLYALQDREQGYGMLGLASEGDVFTHGARITQGQAGFWEPMRLCTNLDEISSWANGANISEPTITQRDAATGLQKRALALPYRVRVDSAQPAVFQVLLARGVSQDQSFTHWQTGFGLFSQVEAEHERADEAFWSTAPRLQGDWPANWRRGLVYDLETLRMIVREPAGIFQKPWDGMQIQAPRTVVAETAMDMLFLSYADPQRAATVLLDFFTSPSRANLPCMREDGSYNMVADDGQICGTAPEWGYPLWCCNELWLRLGDSNWLARLYPGAAAYIRWWLSNRRDQDGWAIYACSWESGQDVSSRFGPQQTGGTRIQHVRPADLQASLAQSAAILASWAAALEASGQENGGGNAYAEEKRFWQEIAHEFTEKTHQLWHNGWFRDYDTAHRIWSSELDIMHLAPLFCQIATPEQIQQIRPVLLHPPAHGTHWAPLSWPPVVLTLIGAALQAGMRSEAAELATRFIAASYQSTDRRELDEDGGLPGITREYLRAITNARGKLQGYSNAGIEGYGWGTLSIHLLLSVLFGLQAIQANHLLICPMLPAELRRIGAVYRIAPLPWGTSFLSLECRVKDAQTYQMRVQAQPYPAPTVHSSGQNENEARVEATQQCEWEAVWGEGRQIQLPQLWLSEIKG